MIYSDKKHFMTKRLVKLYRTRKQELAGYRQIKPSKKIQKSMLNNLSAPKLPPLSAKGAFLQNPYSPSVLDPLIANPLLLSNKKYVNKRKQRLRKNKKKKPLVHFSVERNERVHNVLHSLKGYNFTFSIPASKPKHDIIYRYHDQNDPKSNNI